MAARAFRTSLLAARRVAVAAALLAAVAAAAPARADSPADEAEALIRQGIELRHRSQDARALPLFERAYRLVRTPRTAAQLGLVKMALGYWVDAERMLDEALAAPDHPWIARNAATLEEARAGARRNIGEIVVQGGPDGAEILVNGVPTARLPAAQPIRVDKGRVEVQLRAPGFVSATRALTIAGGARETMSMTLVRAAGGAVAGAAAAPAGVPSARPPVAAEGSGAPILADSPERSTGTRPLPLRPVAWGAAVGAAAALTAGIIETVVASHRIDAFNDHTAPSPIAGDPDRRVPDCATDQLSDACRSLRDSYDSAKTLAIVGYVAAGVLAATSATLFVVANRRDREAAAGTPAMLSCAPVVTAPGVACRLAF